MLTGYFGLLPIIFLIATIMTKAGSKAWILFFVSCFFLLISFGNYFSLWKLIFEYVPLMDHIRFPAAFRLFAILGFLLTAEVTMNNVAIYRRTITSSIILLLIIIVSVLLAYRK